MSYTQRQKTMQRKRRIDVFVLMFILYLLFMLVVDSNEESTSVRRKRYVVFPEGSSFSIALCLTIHTLTPDNIFTEGVNWGISYDLPNESKPELEPFLQLRRDKIIPNKLKKYNSYDNYYTNNDAVFDKKEIYYPLSGEKNYYKTGHHYLQRRYRRNLYNKLEVIINAMGFDGRKCVLRALCEAAQRFMPKGKSLLEEMIRIIFTMPIKRLLSFEPEDHHTYAKAQKAGYKSENCAAMFPECSFSLVDMALGKYNSPDDFTRPADNSQIFRDILSSRFASSTTFNSRYNMK